MKSKFLIRLLAVMVVVYSCQDSKAQKNDWEKEGLKGKVKSVKEVEYNTIDTLGQIQKGILRHHLLKIFNKKGYLIERYYFESDKDTLESKVMYKYDDKWKLLEASRLKPNKSLFSKTVYKYDDNGKTVEENQYNSVGEIFHKDIFKRDTLGNFIEWDSYHSGVDLRELFSTVSGITPTGAVCCDSLRFCRGV